MCSVIQDLAEEEDLQPQLNPRSSDLLHPAVHKRNTWLSVLAARYDSLDLDDVSDVLTLLRQEAGKSFPIKFPANPDTNMAQEFGRLSLEPKPDATMRNQQSGNTSQHKSTAVTD